MRGSGALGDDKKKSGQTSFLFEPPPTTRSPKPESLGDRRFGAKDRPLSVKGLVAVANRLYDQYVGTVWVEGEVSDLKAPRSGHLYFVIKDSQAQVSCVLWSSTAQRLRFRVEQGKSFLLRGRLNIYPEQGRLQLYVEAIEPAGIGADALALAQLKARLSADGLFATERKRTLPGLPKRIGVVTSPTGAAVRDIVRTIDRRYPVPIVLSPSRVQGESAGAEVANAIARICRYHQRQPIDVLIVGRGGGSAEDLAIFNEEVVVRAIAAAPMPVVSAVGHEVDVSLADLVADVRAATPTAAAELVVPERRVLRRELAKTRARLLREIDVCLREHRTILERTQSRLGDPTRLVERARQLLDEKQERMEKIVRTAVAERRRSLSGAQNRLAALHPTARIVADRAKLVELVGRAKAATTAQLYERRGRFESASAKLGALSPLKVLERGYAIARTSDGTVLTDAQRVNKGDELVVRVARGEVKTRVESWNNTDD